MLISLSITNSRSFAATQTFSLLASNRLTSHEKHAIPIPGTDEKVLKTGVIYGANNAGKSNLFRALSYVKKMALQPREKHAGTGRQAFEFGLPKNQSSDFQIRFVTTESVYQFSFRADETKIVEESLLRADKGKERVLYKRTTDEQGKVKIDGPIVGNSPKMKALATIGGPPNQTFLATIRATLEFNDYGEDAKSVFDWFESKLLLIRPEGNFRSLGHMSDENPEFLKFASEFLKVASTGIDALKINKKEISEEELRALIPAPWAERILSKRLAPGSTSSFRFNDESEIRIEKTDKEHFYRITVGAEHEHKPGERISMDISEESDGTRRLLQLLPILHHLMAKGGVFCIDEIDRSMHPLLVWRFIDFFLKSCDKDHQQVIVTTHESTLLDLDLLRSDEIWFAQKGADGATNLYSLAELQVRKDLEIRKHYLSGKFGAVPFMGDKNRLVQEE